MGAALAATAAATLALTSCSAPAEGDSAGSQLRVVATTTQLADFTRQVGGDDVTVTGLLTPGASAHHFDPTPADLLELGRADVLIVNGAGLESFIDSAVESSGFSGTTIVAANGVDLAQAAEITAEEGAGHADDAHAEDAHAEEEAHAEEAGHTDEEAHAEEEGHDHGEVNPHLWTSPQYAADMVQEIARGLAAADPARADDYTARADAYVAQLGELDAWIAAQFDRVPEADRVLVSGHDGMPYYLHDYGIRFAGSILPSFEDNAEPSAAQVDALVAAIREQGVKAVFVESSMGPKLAQTIASEAGVTVVDAESLYVDSLGVAGSGADTYLGATIHNTRTILEAWGVTPDALPSTLS